MTGEQRLIAFQQGLEQLQQQFGVNLIADTQAEKLGEAVLIKPVIRAVLVDQWQPSGNHVVHPNDKETEST